MDIRRVKCVKRALDMDGICRMIGRVTSVLGSECKIQKMPSQKIKDAKRLRYPDVPKTQMLTMLRC